MRTLSLLLKRFDSERPARRKAAQDLISQRRAHPLGIGDPSLLVVGRLRKRGEPFSALPCGRIRESSRSFSGASGRRDSTAATAIVFDFESPAP